MSQLPAQKRKSGIEAVTLTYSSQQILFCRAVLQLRYYLLQLCFWIIVLSSWLSCSQSHSVCAVKTSLPFIFNQQWKIHLGSPQCPVIHSFHSKMGRWIHFVLTKVLDDSDLNWTNLQWCIRVIMIQSPTFELQSSSITITGNFPNKNILLCENPQSPFEDFIYIIILD